MEEVNGINCRIKKGFNSDRTSINLRTDTVAYTNYDDEEKLKQF